MQGRTSLRQALTTIRREFGADVLVTDSQRVLRNPDRIEIDQSEAWTVEGFMRGTNDRWVRDVRQLLSADTSGRVQPLTASVPATAADAATRWIRYASSVDPKAGAEIALASGGALRQLRSDEAVDILIPLEVGGLDPAKEIRLLLLISCVYLDRGQSTLAAEYGHQAYVLAEREGLKALMGTSAERETLAYLEVGDLASARDAITRMKDRCGGACTEFAEALFWIQAEDLDRGGRCLRRARSMALDEGKPFKAQMALLNWADANPRADIGLLQEQYDAIPCEDWPWSQIGRMMMQSLEARRSGRAQDAFDALDLSWRGFAGQQKYRISISILSHFLDSADASGDAAMTARVAGAIIGLRDGERVPLSRAQRRSIDRIGQILRDRFTEEDLRKRLIDGSRAAASGASLL